MEATTIAITSGWEMSFCDGVDNDGDGRVDEERTFVLRWS